MLLACENANTPDLQEKVENVLKRNCDDVDIVKTLGGFKVFNAFFNKLCARGKKRKELHDAERDHQQAAKRQQ